MNSMSPDSRSRYRTTPRKKYYDLWHGVELTPAIKNDSAILSFAIEGNGYGALLSIAANSVNDDLQAVPRAK